MANTQSLNAQKREAVGSTASSRLRSQGLVPAIIYGTDSEPVMLQIEHKEAVTVRGHAHGPNFLVNLVIDGGQPQSALVKSFQDDPLTNQIVHIDLQSVKDDKPIETILPIELTGEAVGTKQGGLVEQLLYRIKVRCLAKDLPETLKVEITQMKVGDSLFVKDLQTPEGVTLLMNKGVIVASVAETRAAKAAAGAGTDEKKKKK